MNDNKHTQPQQSDEIDLGLLFKIIGKWFNNLFVVFIKFFLYLKRNIVILTALTIVGIGIGWLLTTSSGIKKKTEVIVKPNFESKDYLYSIIDEFQSKFLKKDFMFFDSKGFEYKESEVFGVEVKPIEQKEGEDLVTSLEYIESLGDLIQDKTVKELVLNELLSNRSLNHKIIFYYGNANYGQKLAQQIINYINNNDYYNTYKHTFKNNLNQQIESNRVLITQIDTLLHNYSKSLADKKSTSNSETIILDGKDRLNVTEILRLKNSFSSALLANKLELIENEKLINVLYFGNPQNFKIQFNKYAIIYLPLILIGVLTLFLLSILKYINKKSREYLK